MKKLLSLAAALLLFVVGAKADDVYTLSLNSSDTQSTAGYFTLSDNGTYHTKYTGTYNGVTYTKGYKVDSKGIVTFTTTAESSTVTIVQSLATNSDNVLSFDSSNLSTDDRVDYEDSSNTENYNVGVYTISSVAAGTHTIARGNNETGLLYVAVVEEGEGTPTLKGSWDYTEVTATVSDGFTTVPTFSVTLSGSENTLTENDYTVTYSLDSDETTYTSVDDAIAAISTAAAGTVTLTATLVSNNDSYEVSTSTYDCVITIVNVTYTSLDDMATVSEATTWTFADLGTYITLSDTTTPTSSEEYVVSNLVYYGLLTSIPSSFNAEAIALKGAYPLRDKNGYSQGRTWRIKTTVDGTVTVKFSDTGSSGTRDYRYLTINDIPTVYNSNNTTMVTAEALPVAAGDIVISSAYSSGSSADIRVQSITFTPASVEKTVTLDVNGYTTYTSDYAFTVSGATAYAASVSDATVTLTEIGTSVPAGVGVMLYGEANGTATITPATSEPDEVSSNDLVGVSSVTTALEEGTNYVLSNDGVDTQFVGIGSSTIADLAHKAYINIASSSAKSLSISFGEATGINEVAVEAEAAGGAIYNLAGQQVTESYKGVVVKNGKKYMNR